MRAVLLSLLILLFAACDTRTREERDLARAERDLDRAREELAEARDRLDEDIDEARERVYDARQRVRKLGGSSEDKLHEEMERLHEDIREAFEEADIEGTIEAAMDDIEEAIDVDSDVEPVDFRKLRDLLPREIDGMDRVDTEGENSGALGIRLSHVKARYDGVGRDVELAIVDLGTLHRAAQHGLDWLDAHIDRETSNGYERTTEIDGNPAYVKVRERTSRTEIETTVLVASRFVVHIEAEGRDVDMDLVEDILDDLDRLEDLD